MISLPLLHQLCLDSSLVLLLLRLSGAGFLRTTDEAYLSFTSLLNGTVLTGCIAVLWHSGWSDSLGWKNELMANKSSLQ